MRSLLKIVIFPALAAIALSSTTAQAAGASARATVTAEVVTASTIDFSKAVATAAGGKARQPGQTGTQQPQPEVKVVVLAGVTHVSIDYN